MVWKQHTRVVEQIILALPFARAVNVDAVVSPFLHFKPEKGQVFLLPQETWGCNLVPFERYRSYLLNQEAFGCTSW